MAGADGKASLSEFFKFFNNGKQDKFTAGFFKALDVDGSGGSEGTLSFQEFAVMIFDFLSLDFDGVVEFSFLMFDKVRGLASVAITACPSLRGLRSSRVLKAMATHYMYSSASHGVAIAQPQPMASCHNRGHHLQVTSFHPPTHPTTTTHPGQGRVSLHGRAEDDRQEHRVQKGPKIEQV